MSSFLNKRWSKLTFLEHLFAELHHLPSLFHHHSFGFSEVEGNTQMASFVKDRVDQLSTVDTSYEQG